MDSSHKYRGSSQSSSVSVLASLEKYSPTTPLCKVLGYKRLMIMTFTARCRRYTLLTRASLSHERVVANTSGLFGGLASSQGRVVDCMLDLRSTTTFEL